MKCDSDPEDGFVLSPCHDGNDNDNDNDSQKRSTNISQRPGLTGMSEGVITPRKKKVC